MVKIKCKNPRIKIKPVKEMAMTAILQVELLGSNGNRFASVDNTEKVRDVVAAKTQMLELAKSRAIMLISPINIAPKIT